MADMPTSQDEPLRPSTAQVLFRFTLRTLLLAAFAAFSGRGFASTFGSLLALAAIYCAFVAAVRREAPFGAGLNHFDEAVANAIGALAAAWAA